MKTFDLEATALLPATLRVTIDAETSDEAVAKLNHRLAREGFSWTVGDNSVPVPAGDIFEVTDVESHTRDDEAAESQSSGMYCATFALLLEPTPDHRDNSINGFTDRLFDLMEGARMANDPSSPILDWDHTSANPVSGDIPGEARITIGLYAYGMSSQDAMSILHKTLLRAIAAADDNLISSVTRKTVWMVPLEKAQRMQAEGEAGTTSPLRRRYEDTLHEHGAQVSRNASRKRKPRLAF